MKILFTGDINFRELENLDLYKSEDILSEVKPYIEKADYVIPNLECPLGDKAKYTPIKKSGPNLISSEENVCFLKAINAYAVSLANNHIGDFGGKALKNTLSVLTKNNINHFGAGENISKAYRALRVENNKIKVSIISVCENEFGTSTESNMGSAGYNPRILMNKIKEEKKVSDFVIVVFHGGNEFNPLPSPDTAERYRFICDMGADAVIAGHTHCPQGYEIYNEKPIIYSMGNFLFKNSQKTEQNDPWYYGYMTLIDIGDKISFEIIPYRYDKNAEKITVFDGSKKEKMMEYINKLSDIIKNPKELKQLFKGWSLNHLWVPKLPDNMEDISNYNSSGNFNLICCESHLSQAKQIFEILFNEEVRETEKWQDKIKDLQNMPV